MRNPPIALKAFADNNSNETKIPMPTYIGSNTQYLSIPFLQFNLRGQGKCREMYIDPPILEYKEDLYIFKSYTRNIIMKKKLKSEDKSLTTDNSGSGYKKSIRVEGRSDESFIVDIDSKKFNESTTSEEEIDIAITILSKTCGVKTAYLMIDIEDGVPLSYFIQAKFIGPLVSIVEPDVEFGLQKINTHTSFTMNITNHSPIEAPIIIKNSKDFTSYTFEKYLEEYNAELNESAKQERKVKAKNHKSVRIMSTHIGNKITFQPQYIVIPPDSRGEITVTLNCTHEEEISEILEILVQNSQSQFIKLNANIQKIKVCLNRYSLDLGKIYAGIKQTVDGSHQQAIVLKNYGNLPAKFQWNEKVIPDQLKTMFEPARGTIAPHSEFVVNIKLTSYIGGDLSEIFTCDVTDLDFPLGFCLTANVFGLRVAHVLPDFVVEAQKAALSMGMTGTKSKFMTATIIKEAEEEESEEITEEQRDDKNRLRSLKFPSCTINKPSTQKFVLKNYSGIKTTFSFKAVTYEPDNLVLPASIQGKSSLDELPKQDMDDTMTVSKPGSKSSKRETKIRFALTKKSKKGQLDVQLKRPLLSDSHEHLNKFSSKTGETFTATKRLEREQAFYLSNNKGLAIVFSPAFGELKPHSEIPINVTIYNNACGRFEDVLISEIKGLPLFKFPIFASISGSPLIIPDNQVGLNYFTSPPTMAFPTLVDNSPQVSKTFKIKNTGIADVNLEWNIFDQRDQKNRSPEENLFNITIGKNTGFDSEENPFKLNFELIEPHPSTNSPFEIVPQRAIIPARETQFFEVKFNSNQGVDTFKSVILAHPKLAENIEIQNEHAHLAERESNKHNKKDLYDYNSDSSEENNQNHNNDEYNQHYDNNQEPSLQEHMSKDRITESDRKSEFDAAQDAAKRSLGIVALNLFAKTIEPVLSIDMKRKLDSEHYFNFYQWPMNHEEEPSAIEKISLVNETKANLIFNLLTEGPFKIVATKTNSGSVHPLTASKPSSRGVRSKAETMFSLQPDKLVQMKIEFSPPDPNNINEWPVVQAFVKRGLIKAMYANGKIQSFNLVGNLLRPKVSVMTLKPCKNEKGVDEIDLGEVNIEKNTKTMFYLINDTTVPAKWALNYVKFPKKATIGYMTKTPLEIENMDKTDDPEVFQFSITSGCLKGPSIPLRVAPEGLALPSVTKNSAEEEYLPKRIMVNFKPKANILYKSMFRFTVEHGMSYDIIFKGKGSYEEDYDND